MKFIDKGDKVQVQIAFERRVNHWQILADFEIPKDDFQAFLEHAEKEVKKAYKRDELFPSIKKGE